MNIDYQTIGKRIKTARAKADITQEVLAEKTSLSITHISNIEHGSTKLSLKTLVNIADALNVSVDGLLSENLINSRKGFASELKCILSDCSSSETCLLMALLRANKNALRTHIDCNEHTKK